MLFENLRRAVDDLYRTCEGDESAVAAKVGILFVLVLLSSISYDLYAKVQHVYVSVYTEGS